MKRFNLVSKITLLTTTLVVSNTTFAGTPAVSVPEPSMIGLFAAAGVVAFLLKKRK